MCVRAAVQFFFVKKPVTAGFFCTFARLLLPTLFWNIALTGENGFKPLHDCFFDRCTFARLLGAFVQKWETDFGAVSISEKETKRTERGRIRPFRAVAHACPCHRRTKEPPTPSTEAGKPATGRTWALGGETKATPLQSSARCRCVKGCYFH